EQAELEGVRRKVGQLQRALGRKTDELEVAGNARNAGLGLGLGVGVGVRVARSRSRAMVAATAGYRPAVAARVAGISRPAIDRRRRPGFFRVTRPDALWHLDLDMTKVWGLDRPARLGLACTRPSTAAPARSPAGRWSCAATDDEAIACVEAAVLARGVPPGPG